jgi:hypothetical protein
VGPDLRPARRGRDRQLLLLDGIRRDRLAVLGPEPAARPLVHPPPSRSHECRVSPLVGAVSFVVVSAEIVRRPLAGGRTALLALLTLVLAVSLALRRRALGRARDRDRGARGGVLRHVAARWGLVIIVAGVVGYFVGTPGLRAHRSESALLRPARLACGLADRLPRPGGASMAVAPRLKTGRSCDRPRLTA